MSLKKSFVLAVLILVLLVTNFNKSLGQIDSSAVAILDRMSFVLSNLTSVSLVLKTEYDINTERFGLVQNTEVADIFMKGPDKLLVNKNGDKGKNDFYYDGKTFTIFSPLNDSYATADAPANIIALIDNFHNNYGIDFPGSDLFFPDFVNDLLAVAGNLTNLGTTMTNDKKCFHIAGTTADLTFQLWIADDETYLPVKMSLVYTNMPGNPQYEANYENWNINPVLEDSKFIFTPPAGSKKIKLVKISNN